MRVQRIVVGALQVNCYLLADQAGRAVVVDPGAEPDRILQEAESLGWRIEGIVNTHFHVDHVGSNAPVQEATGAPIHIGREDAPLLERNFDMGLGALLKARPSPPADHLLDQGDRVAVGEESLEVIACPGHSPGGISLVADGFVITGDTLFREGIGRTDFPGCSTAALMGSIRERLLPLPEKLGVSPEDLRVLPGHGPESTMGHEIRSNPYLRSARR